MAIEWKGNFERLDEFRWMIPQDACEGMRVPGIIYTSEKNVETIRSDNTPTQVIGVAHLPGIVKASLAMPDIHWGYGFPIGGVAAMNIDDGVVSPGGVGYDINCGVRTLRTNLLAKDIRPKIPTLIDTLFSQIPCGVGKGGKLRVNYQDLDKVLATGSEWAVKNGFGKKEDLEHTEAKGAIPDADPSLVGKRAKERGLPQLGTLGSGNHFLEIQEVEAIYDQSTAEALGIFPGQILVMIHSGSRGLGYQVCDDYLVVMGRIQEKYKLHLPDRQLAGAPIESPEGKEYLGAMACAANYAWCNRQVIMHWTRETLMKVLNISPKDFGGELIYDVAHNIAKFEEHTVDGKQKRLLVHRKGATRAFGPGHTELPKDYLEIGQPVIVPGDMGTASYLLVGTKLAMEDTFGSTCHGAGRRLSRHEAMRVAKGRRIDKELAEKGIYVQAFGRGTLAEEMPEAYKDVDEVIAVVDGAGISRKVARVVPMGVMKG